MKFGVREICDVVLKAKSAVKIGSTQFSAGQPVLYIDSAKTSSLEGAATTVYAQGGRGNARLIAWEGERTLTFTLEDALISPAGFAILSGAGLVEAASNNKIHVHSTADVLLGASGTATLTAEDLGATDAAPVSIYQNPGKADVYGTILDETGAGIKFLKLKTVPTAETVTTVAPTAAAASEGKAAVVTNVAFVFDMTTEEATIYAGKAIRIDYYIEKTSGVQEITIDTKNFAGYYYLEASTLFRREDTGEDMPAEFVIPNAKIQSNFTFTMASTGDPSTFTFKMDAMPGYTNFDKTKKVLCALQIVDDGTGIEL